jgi:hypothetical protein
MDRKMQVIFNRLKADIASRHFTAGDMQDLISNFMENQPAIGMALLQHSRDILFEDVTDAAGQETGSKEAHNYGDIVCEMYRRTFFEKETAAQYGMEVLTHTHAKAMVDFIVSAGAMHDEATHEGSEGLH